MFQILRNLLKVKGLASITLSETIRIILSLQILEKLLIFLKFSGESLDTESNISVLR